jgi:hypothetical protein
LNGVLDHLYPLIACEKGGLGIVDGDGYDNFFKQIARSAKQIYMAVGDGIKATRKQSGLRHADIA